MRKMIVIEGLDGSGKATQAQLLAAALQERGAHVREVSFPDYNSPSSALVKMYLGGQFGSHPEDVNAFAASSFYAVDRYASFKKDWQADYESGVIIADRYTTSNAIHQCSKLPRAEWDHYLDWLFHYEYELLGIPKPNLVVYLRVDPEVSQKLMKERYHGEDLRDIHEKDLEYLRSCREAAEYCAEKLGWRVVECCENGAMRSIEDIQAEIFALTQELQSAPRPAESDWRLIDLKTAPHPETKYGRLTFLEANRDIPFTVRRVYWITGTEAGLHRGFHAHKRNSQLLFCPRGVIDLILDDGKTKTTVRLDDPGKGLLLLPGLWREMIWQEDDSVLCVLASEYYDPEEYIRDYDSFLAYRNQNEN